jgi:hypothetical protein
MTTGGLKERGCTKDQLMIVLEGRLTSTPFTYIQLHEKMIVNVKEVIIWKEDAVTYFKVLSLHLLGKTEKTMKRLSWNTW